MPSKNLVITRLGHEEVSAMTINDELWDAIVFAERGVVLKIVQAAVDNDEDLVELLNNTMIPALREVGDQFSAGEVFVPEMLASAKAMQAAIDIVGPLLAKTGHKPIAKVCIGSVRGDLHDIGKNLVAIMLRGSGFEVDDLGVNCRVEDFEAAVQRGAEVVCLSALLSTTRDAMRPVADHFRDRDEVKVVVGGAVITQEFADVIGADGFGFDASDAIRAVRECLGLAGTPA
jgi:5-methyltetrahydrofolate--homocysteine methyltransferase